MKSVRRIPFVLFIVCLVAAMPFSWGAGGLKDSVLAEPVNPTVNQCRVPPRRLLDGIPSPVPKTGQTACWDQDGNQIDCAGTGQDGEFQTGVAVLPRFTDNGDGTVTDNLTGLIWLKDANCLGNLSWNEALIAAKSLASGSCGLTDGSVAGAWRLPNINELGSLIDFGRVTPAIPNGNPFPYVPNGSMWSSTTFVADPAAAWIGEVNGGDVFGYYKLNNPNGVWPVRGGQ